mgnify:CR=1 FL=1
MLLFIFRDTMFIASFKRCHIFALERFYSSFEIFVCWTLCDLSRFDGQKINAKNWRKYRFSLHFNPVDKNSNNNLDLFCKYFMTMLLQKISSVVYAFLFSVRFFEKVSHSNNIVPYISILLVA